MGSFDTLKVQIVLPDCSEVVDDVFQTKSLDCTMDTYVISQNRELYRERWRYEMVDVHDAPISQHLVRVPDSMRREYLTGFTGEIIFYGEWQPRPNVWRDYHARFTDGILKEIKYVDREL